MSNNQRAEKPMLERHEELSDAELVAAVADVVRRPRQDPASSFVLHAPLELAARTALLPRIAPAAREQARLRLVALATEYEGSDDPIAEPPARDAGSAADESKHLLDAIAAGDLDAVDVGAACLARSATAPQLRGLLADPLVPLLAAAAHAPIFLFELPRVAPTWRAPGRAAASVGPRARSSPRLATQLVRAEHGTRSSVVTGRALRRHRTDTTAGRSRQRLHLPGHVPGAGVGNGHGSRRPRAPPARHPRRGAGRAPRRGSLDAHRGSRVRTVRMVALPDAPAGRARHRGRVPRPAGPARGGDDVRRRVPRGVRTTALAARLLARGERTRAGRRTCRRPRGGGGHGVARAQPRSSTRWSPCW